MPLRRLPTDDARLLGDRPAGPELGLRQQRLLRRRRVSAGVRWRRAISPQKSVEGAMAGLVGAAIVGAVLGLPAGSPPLLMAGYGLAIGLATVVGDLVESLLKRQTGRQGFRRADPWPRRAARSHGQPALLRARRGPVLARVQRHEAHRRAGQHGLDRPPDARRRALAPRRVPGCGARRRHALGRLRRSRCSEFQPARGLPDVAQTAPSRWSTSPAIPTSTSLVVATSGTVGFRPTIAALRGRQAGRAGQQRDADHGRPSGHRPPRPRAARRCCRSTASTARSGSACRARSRTPERVQRLLLTASGGAFRDRPVESLADVTPGRGAAPSDVDAWGPRSRSTRPR